MPTWRNLFLWILVISGLFALPLSAGEPSDLLSGIDNSPDKTLNITSDKLLSDRNSNYIIFSGNVEAVYGETTITADDLKVMLLNDPKAQGQLNEGKIDKIIATGHVIIKLENNTGYCDQAVYTPKTKTILLTGNDVRIQSDDNYITGEKITIRQPTGQIIVDGNPDKRVNAVFKPGKNSSDIFNNQTSDPQK